MAKTELRVFPSPDAIGDHLAPLLLQRIESTRLSRERFYLGCPTGRTPRPIYNAMARLLSEKPQDISHLVMVMMDEYLVGAEGGLEYAAANNSWSCHHFAHAEIAARLNEGLPSKRQLQNDSIWFPDPREPDAYDKRIAEVGGINFFILASGASDGHVAFNPPGSARDSRTRIVALSEETRRDNLQTFPIFGTLAQVPSHGISVGIATIASAKEAAMVVWGGAKKLTLSRILAADRYDPQWPATVIHEVATRQILCDTVASAPSGTL